VCKRWYRLSQDDSLWKRLDLGVRTVPPGVVGQVRLKYVPVLLMFVVIEFRIFFGLSMNRF
jgi:hypothetical protein